MPEIKHNFTGGKMNKDLDERLVPNGQYRDAMNIQVSTSEGSDVGTAQNILGNSLISGQGFIPSTAKCVGSIADEKNDKLYYFIINKVNLASTSNATSVGDGAVVNSIDKITFAPNAGSDRVTPIVNASELTSGKTYIASATISEYEDLDPSILNTIGFSSQGGLSSAVGDSRLTGNGIIYHEFVSDGNAVRVFAGDEVGGVISNISVFDKEDIISFIVEYDSTTNAITPVVVDTSNTALSFEPNRLITGVNIIDNMLLWTDNHSEPKKINIPRCIKGTDKSGTIQTKLINESRGIDINSNVDLKEKHITVIRKSPRTAPIIDLISGRFDGAAYGGIMRITTDPGGLEDDPNVENIQNASSLWFSSTNQYNHLYDFSELKVGDRFRTNIETDINGDSGFDLDWEVGDTVVFKEFGGVAYDEAPPIPITDYTIKAKVLGSGSNVFSDQVSEIAPNVNIDEPNTSGFKPRYFDWTSADIEYDSNSIDSKIVFDNVGPSEPVIGTALPQFAFGAGSLAGTYKIRVEIANMTAATDAVFGILKTVSGANHSWGFPSLLVNGVNETTVTLDTNVSTTSSTAAVSASGLTSALSGKFYIQTGSGSNNSFEILNISIQRQDVTDAGVKLEVLGINGTPPTVPEGYSELRYAVDLLDEEENLFEFKFPRFAYRYQYEDKEYSTFSPFTEVAFLPGSFDFHPQKGYNLGMTNNLKEITISGFIPSNGYVDDVVAIDILYKDEASPNIYIVDTIKNNQHNSDIWINDRYTIKSESVKRVLPSNQLLRPWDTVPKKALAQEISGNRVIYGNYTQGFDLLKPGSKQEYYPDFNFNIRSNEIGLNTVKSIKSLREYQLGVVFVDKYGRETPVLSNTSGLDKIPKSEAAKSNEMEVSFGDTVFPEDMEYFKFFIKETSGEYYNMTMDRWWDAGDGLAWLSFGSADINKIDIDTFLILKKGVESNDLVTEQARYKVLAIDTEAPDHIKTKKLLIEEKKHTYANDGSRNIFENTIVNAPVLGRDNFQMRYKSFSSGTGSELQDIKDETLYVEFVLGNIVSKRYKVVELTSNKDQDGISTNDAIYSVKLAKPLGDDVNFITDDPNDGLNATKIVDETVVNIYKYIPENSSEFDGRFFVKVISDGVFNKYVTKTTANTTQYRPVLSKKLYYMGDNQADLHTDVLTGQTHGFYQDDVDGNASSFVSYNNENSFGRFAPFFRNYRFLSDNQTATGVLPGNTFGDIDVGQYRFDNTSTIEWLAELRYTTARGQFVYDLSLPTPDLKIADHSALDDADADSDKRYGVFNEDGEQTRGNVWFIDGGPYSGARSASSNSLHWPWLSNSGADLSSNDGGTRYNYGIINDPGGNYASIAIAMGGIYNPEVNDSSNNSINDFYNIGTDEANGGWYSGKKFKDLVGKIKPTIKFRFREDPAGEVYTIKASGVYYQNLVRWSDGDPSNYPSGEYPAYNNPDLNIIGESGIPQLSPNHTRGYNTRFTNDRLGDGTVTWDPTNGGTTGPIPNGLNLTVTYASSPPSGILNNQVYVSDIHDITCSVHQQPYSITKGMILTSYGSVLLNATLPLTTTTYSYEPLIVSKIEKYPSTGSITGYIITLIGYSSPLISASGPVTSATNIDLKPHRVFSTTTGHNSPAAGDSLVFQQPAMNGYSQYSVNRINAQNANQQTSTNSFNSSTGGLQAVGYTIEFLEEIEEEIQFPNNPAIWETEPKETTDLDIYYEASGYNPLYITEDTKNLIVPPGSLVECVESPGATIGDMQVSSIDNVPISGATATGVVGTGPWRLTLSTKFTLDKPLIGTNYIQIGKHLKITKPDGNIITVEITGWDASVGFTGYPTRSPYIYIKDALHGPDTKYTLNWYNCYSFGNGVESNRIRDTYNLPYMANGVKASTTLDENPYEETLKYGLIYSGIYNGAVGINNLNQFISAEKITKNINPIYGSIQKLKAGWGQGGDLITLCEDRVLKILANKDALFNADGNSNLTSTNSVLGQAIPYSGEYGISKNPESFASEAYRAYFTDKVRGTVMRLSMDGLTPISNAGMKDWFRDNLKLSNKLIGSYDDRQDEYNVTLPASGYTVSYKEDVKGWVSFKSFTKETGVSCANNYHTFANGRLWKHYVENFSELTKVTVTGVEFASGPDGRYFFFEISEMDNLLGGIWSAVGGGNSSVNFEKQVVMKQYRNNVLIYSGLMYAWDNNDVNSSLTNSPSGGPTKGFGRRTESDGNWGTTSNAGDFEVGDIIVMGNIDRNTFYDAFTNSSLDVILNSIPSSIKSYHTLEYEGSKSRVEGVKRIIVDSITWTGAGTNPDGRYVMDFDVNTMNAFLNTTNWNGTEFQGKQYRNGVLLYSGSMIAFDNTNGIHLRRNPFSAGSQDFEIGDIITTQAQEDSVIYSNSTPTDGWYVSGIETNKEKGSLLEFIEKEGKWFNYIKGIESEINEITDFGSFDIQGLGVIESIEYKGGVGSYPCSFTLGGGVNASVQVGDTIYHESTTKIYGDNLLPSIDAVNWATASTHKLDIDYSGVGALVSADSSIVTVQYPYFYSSYIDLVDGTEYRVRIKASNYNNGGDTSVIKNYIYGGGGVWYRPLPGQHPEVIDGIVDYYFTFDQAANNGSTAVRFHLELSNGDDFSKSVRLESVELQTTVPGEALGFVRLDSNQLQKAGLVTGESGNTVSVGNNPGTPPEPGDYIFFVKNQVVNMNGLSGYYADAKFQNNSKVKAELFAVSSEVTESSK